MPHNAAMQPAPSIARARLGAFVAIVFWGISFVATKRALAELSPVALVTLRFAIGTGFLAVVLAVRRVSLPPVSSLPSLALMGFIGVFVHQLVQVTGLTMTTAINTGWLIGLTPIWAAILSALFRGERFGSLRIAGMMLGFAGALLVVTHGELSAATFALPSARGDLLVLLSTVNWALYTILGHGTIRTLGGLRATAGSIFLGWLMLGPIFVAQAGWRELPHLTPTGWFAVVFLGVGCSGAGYLLWYSALETLEAGSVASFLYVEPLVTLLAAAVLLGERVSPVTALGGAIVIAGVVLVQRREAKPARAS